MKKGLIFSYAALLLSLLLPKTAANTAVPPEIKPTEAPEITAKPQNRKIILLRDGESVETDLEEYIVLVLSAEMPASFENEALKAQAVAARSYALYCASGNKHGTAQLCTDSRCCQAWQSEEQLHEKWGDKYELYHTKIKNAVRDTAGQYLSYDGQAVFAAFHSSSAGYTESSGDIWSALPYLTSVSSPESSDDVPNYISEVRIESIDFRDSILHTRPDADMSGSAEEWIKDVERDDSGRVSGIDIGGEQFKGTEIRNLFSLRSTAFNINVENNEIVFTVTGYGHGVGMSQYGANVMAKNGADYIEILSHYYPGTVLEA